MLKLIALVTTLVFSTSVWAYEFDKQYGIETIVVQPGDKGVYGAAKWLGERKLLPRKPDGKIMSVAEAYVKICLKNFETLKECEEESRNFQPGEMLKVDVPVIPRKQWDDRLTAKVEQEVSKPLEAKIATLNAQIKESDAQVQAKEAKIQELDGVVSKLKATIGGLNRTIKEQNQTLSDLMQSHDALKQRVKDFGQKVRENMSGFAKDLKAVNSAPWDWKVYKNDPIVPILAIVFLGLTLYFIRRDHNKAAAELKSRGDRITDLERELELFKSMKGEQIDGFEIDPNPWYVCKLTKPGSNSVCGDLTKHPKDHRAQHHDSPKIVRVPKNPFESTSSKTTH